MHRRSMNHGPRDLTALELVLVTDGRGDGDRLVRLVTGVVSGGVRAVQLREPSMTARRLAELCKVLLPVLEQVGGLLLVNDRADVVAAGLAHGVHLGAGSLLAGQVRRFLPEACVVGCSAHDPGSLARARGEGADYASLSPIFPTSCKPGAQPLGVQRAAEWTATAGLPVVWLGGLTASNLHLVQRRGALGFALRSGLCAAADPRREASHLRTSLEASLW